MTYKPDQKLIEDISEAITSPREGDYTSHPNGFDLGGQSQYDFKYLVFPNDLGTENNGHYMVININVPVKPETSTPRGNLGNLYSTPLNEESKLNNLRNRGETIMGTSLRADNNGQFRMVDTSGATQGEVFRVPRYVKRIAESIALFMPSSVLYTTAHAYEDISMTALLGTVGVGAVTGALSGLGGRGAAAAAGAASVVGNLAQSAGRVAQIAGVPINPRVEVLYATTPQRQFVFELLLAPRTEEESRAIKSIIKTLRFHAAPELLRGGMVLIPPAEFDITFFNKGVENTNIPRINTCVLERIETDFSPTGAYSTFSNGHPVAIRLSLGFRELEIGHALRISQGF